MFKFYATGFFLVFLTSETCSSAILQNVLSNLQTSDAVVTVFSSIGWLIEPGEYVQNLNVRPDTCSIRIDFKNFSFNQPTKLLNTSAFTCESELDVLELSVLGIPIINIPKLCGELSGQHIYLPTQDYEETLLDATVLRTLNLKVTYLGLDSLLSKVPLWDIILTQLPCPVKNDVELPEVPQPSISLPPIGCLQYYTESEGIIESFNFFDGLGHYLGNLDYAICFRRLTDTRGIKLLGLDFNLAANGNSSTERDCDTADANAVNVNAVVGLNKLLSRDYLLISDGVTINAGVSVYASKYCGNSLKDREVTVTRPGPLFISVITDALNNQQSNAEVGFRIKYELLKNDQ